MKHTTKHTERSPTLMARLTGGRKGAVKKTTIIKTTESPPRRTHGIGRSSGHTGRSHGFGHSHHTHNTRSTVGHKPTTGDKVDGKWMKLKGSLTHRPGLKAAGTRKERGHFGPRKMQRY